MESTQLTCSLYRPVGQREYDKLKAREFTAWPPRLPEHIIGRIEVIRIFTIEGEIPSEQLEDFQSSL